MYYVREPLVPRYSQRVHLRDGVYSCVFMKCRQIHEESILRNGNVSCVRLQPVESYYERFIPRDDLYLCVLTVLVVYIWVIYRWDHQGQVLRGQILWKAVHGQDGRPHHQDGLCVLSHGLRLGEDRTEVRGDHVYVWRRHEAQICIWVQL